MESERKHADFIEGTFCPVWFLGFVWWSEHFACFHLGDGRQMEVCGGQRQGRGGQGWEAERQSEPRCEAGTIWSLMSLLLCGSGEPICIIPAAALPMQSGGCGVAVASLKGGPLLESSPEAGCRYGPSLVCVKGK